MRSQIYGPSDHSRDVLENRHQDSQGLSPASENTSIFLSFSTLESRILDDNFAAVNSGDLGAMNDARLGRSAPLYDQPNVSSLCIESCQTRLRVLNSTNPAANKPFLGEVQTDKGDFFFFDLCVLQCWWFQFNFLSSTSTLQVREWMIVTSRFCTKSVFLASSVVKISTQIHNCLVRAERNKQ